MKAALVGLLVAVSLFFVEGCSSDGGKADSAECRDMAQAECEARDDCFVIDARVEGPDGPTDEVVPFVGCGGDEVCGDAITCAWNGADEQVLWFPSTCIPYGWVETDCQATPTVADITEDGIEIKATQIDGVWVFRYDPQGWHDALLEGPASIVDGCLYIGDYLVVWHVDRLGELEGIIAAVQAGEEPEVAVGGSGRVVGTDPEGGGFWELPSVIAEHCSADAVWFGSPD